MAASVAAAQPVGVFTLPVEAYHDDPCERPSLSSSIASILCNRTPKHARHAHPKLNPDFVREEKERWDVGTAAHALLLEDRSLEDVVEIIDAADWRTNAAKAARDEARAAGKIPLLRHVVSDVTAMFESAREQLNRVKAHPPLLVAGKAEQTLIWEEDGVTCRALVDWLHDDHLAIDDYKTTSASADPERWTSRTLFSIGADVQTAFYLRGLRAVSGNPPLADYDPVMRYIVQETYPPYALAVTSCGPDVLAAGERKVERAIALWRECLEKDEWPGYPSQIAYAELPGWEEERLMRLEEQWAA